MKVGDEVGWKWGNGLATGRIEEISPERTEIVSKNTHVVRNGTADDPAVRIRQSNGTEVLKLQHEVQTVTK